ncbi:Putative acyl-CoA dehydrogenase FadE17 [bacterium HR23]|nr:Putative acyl-CoA dehydrogenase FadE17 [bacterium HR23]
MDFQFTPQEEAFREEVRAFIRAEVPPDFDGGELGEEEWEMTRRLRKKLAQKGWLTLHWPKEYGGMGASPITQLIFNEEMSYGRCPGRDIFGTRMMAPTLMIWGTEEQKKRFLPPVARGEVQWCQGYSEPGSGSDLASLQTRAVRDGDDYVINGSKIWTSLAHRADWIMLLARTNPEAEKHRGISFFLVDMHSPGISVRPIINMANIHSFNQVFFDNVRVPKENLVGEENRGWYVAVTLLDFERSGVDYSASARRTLEDLAQFAREFAPSGRPLAGDARVRNALADLYVQAQAARMIAYNVAWMQSKGLVPNKESSASKVFGTELVQRVTNFGVNLMGLYGQLLKGSKWAKLNGRLQTAWLMSFSHTIAGGTSEIQRNIIAMRGLGLPRG